jgi:hypothetical protein
MKMKSLNLSFFALMIGFASMAQAENNTVCSVQIGGRTVYQSDSAQLDSVLVDQNGVSVELRGPGENDTVISLIARVKDGSTVRTVRGQQVALDMGSEASIDASIHSKQTKKSVVVKAHCENSFGD